MAVYAGYAGYVELHQKPLSGSPKPIVKQRKRQIKLFNMRALIVIILTLVVTITSCYSQSGFITGRVFCQFSKETLQNAKIILKKNNKYLCKTKTDHAGNYWFSQLRKGNYTLWILHDGYCQLEMDSITLSNDSTIELDLGLMENATNSNVETNGKIYMLYHDPISVNLVAQTNYQNYKNNQVRYYDTRK